MLHKIDPESLAALPNGAGVYIFKGQGTLPLYIGKSVNIRSRVLSHLRTPDEASMIAQTRRIDFIETAGELGALLLESRMIKEQSPLFNQRLRRVRRFSSLRLRQTDKGTTPEIVDSKTVNLGTTPKLFGLFSSNHAAKQKLNDLAQQHGLCKVVLGLEKTSTRGCFGLQIKTCLGACVGQEERLAHDGRLLTALMDMQIEVWPYSGPVDLIEENNGWVQKHRINNWCHLETWCSKTRQATQVTTFNPHDFDRDSYQILVRPIMLQTVNIQRQTP
jgi:excinuclease Cho